MHFSNLMQSFVQKNCIDGSAVDAFIALLREAGKGPDHVTLPETAKTRGAPNEAVNISTIEWSYRVMYM
jgi:hypothetical protein